MKDWNSGKISWRVNMFGGTTNMVYINLFNREHDSGCRGGMSGGVLRDTEGDGGIGVDGIGIRVSMEVGGETSGDVGITVIPGITYYDAATGGVLRMWPNDG
jgi:hypothetical protein